MKRTTKTPRAEKLRAEKLPKRSAARSAASPGTPVSGEEYNSLFNEAVRRIQEARNAFAVQLNTTVLSTHWSLGRLLHERKVEGGYGSAVIIQLSADLRNRFPSMGLSPRNLWYMKKFYERYAGSPEKLQRGVAVLPWRKNLLLLERNLDDDATFFYATECLRRNWTKDLLLNAIKMDVYASEKGRSLDNNFDETLPATQAAYAAEVFRDSYDLGFLGATQPLAERELETRIVERIKRFLLELGTGFTFIGNQHRLEFNGKEYFVDLLFFHRRLRSLVAVELKIGEFRSEFVGKMNLYLSLLDRMEKSADENPSIGIILCAEKDHLDVEIALQDISKPIAVAEYQLALPKQALQDAVLQEIANPAVPTT